MTRQELNTKVEKMIKAYTTLSNGDFAGYHNLSANLTQGQLDSKYSRNNEATMSKLEGMTDDMVSVVLECGRQQSKRPLKAWAMEIMQANGIAL